jgi:hypothetical protein
MNSKYEKIADWLAERYMAVQERKQASDDSRQGANWLSGLGIGTASAAGEMGLRSFLESKGMGSLKSVQSDAEAVSQMAKELKKLEALKFSNEANVLRSRIEATMKRRAQGVPSMFGRMKRTGKAFGVGGLIGAYVLPPLVNSVLSVKPPGQT